MITILLILAALVALVLYALGYLGPACNVLISFCAWGALVASALVMVVLFSDFFGFLIMAATAVFVVVVVFENLVTLLRGEGAADD